MTWKEFKAVVEKQGVLDTDLIDYIDFTTCEDASPVAYRDDLFGYAVETSITN